MFFAHFFSLNCWMICKQTAPFACTMFSIFKWLWNGTLEKRIFIPLRLSAIKLTSNVNKFWLLTTYVYCTLYNCIMRKIKLKRIYIWERLREILLRWTKKMESLDPFLYWMNCRFIFVLRSTSDRKILSSFRRILIDRQMFVPYNFTRRVLYKALHLYTVLDDHLRFNLRHSLTKWCSRNKSR